MKDQKSKSKETPKPTTRFTPTATVPPPPLNIVPVRQFRPGQRNLTPNIDNADFHHSAYFKIRALACQLRPHFIQVLHTPDFRNCKAAHEIRIQMNLMGYLYKQMIAETGQHETFVSAQRRLADDNLPGNDFSGGHRGSNKSGMPQPKQTLEESLEDKPQTPHFSSEKKVDSCISLRRQSYIVGGSVCGWNFITYSGGKPVYCGVTKKSFRSRRKKSCRRTSKISSAHTN